MFDKSYHDSTNNENSSHSIIVFNVHSMLKDIEYGIGLSFIYYIMVLLRFQIICLYAKLIMSSYLLYSCLLFSDLNMTSFSPLITILNQNTLTGSNYVDWKRNLDIVLTVEEHKYVLTKPCPNFPSLDAPLEEKQRYDCW